MSNSLHRSSIYPSLTRRDFLRGVCAGTTLLLTSGVVAGCATSPAQAPAPAAAPAAAPSAFTPDLEVQLTAAPAEVHILPGAPTAVWRYTAQVRSGDANAVQAIPNSYLGPILRVRKGQKVRIHLQNDLPEATNIHWHGLLVPSAMDGHPSDAVAPGQSYVYDFEVRNRAGTYWFHPHPHGTTAAQVIKGLAGLFIVTDEEETALALPSAAQDLPLVLQDRTFDTLNQFVYNVDGMSHLGQMGGMMNMTAMMGFLGTKILVNGQPNVTLPVATRAYRLRLLNGSNSRIYKLAWSNDLPLTVIATDGGLLEKPAQRPYVTLAPAERVELWVDFSQQGVGDELTLRSLAYTGVEAGMMMEDEGGLPNGADFAVLTVRVERAEPETHTLPAQLVALQGNRPADAVNSRVPRPFELTMHNMQWLINGKQFEMDAVDASEKVAFNSLEVWEFINQQGAGDMSAMSGGGMSGMNHGNRGASTGNMGMQSMMNDFMAHPMHIHGVQFQVIDRQIATAQRAGWATLKDGFVDEGWKDTVLVMPGERVQVLLRFNEYPGRYLVHCHNLEHESMGMMRNFQIV